MSTESGPAGADTLRPSDGTPAQWIEHAWATAKSGRSIEAVEWLTERNREQRDDEVEYELIRLRHRAFGEVSTDPLPSWPPTVPDVFEGVQGLPEITVDQLSVETLSSGILHHGALLVRGL